MAARWVSKAEFSRMAGVSDVAVSKACKPGGALAAACRDGRINIDHAAAAAYLKAKGKTAPKVPAAPTAPPPKGAKRSTAPPTLRPAPPKGSQGGDALPTAPRSMKELLREGPESIEDIDQYADMSLRELAQRFGSMSAHKDWLEMRKRQVEIQEKEIKNRELQGKLISRELVRTHVFGAIEESHSRLLSDAARTIALRLGDMVKSGATTEATEVTVRDLIGAVLQPVKERAARVLRKAARMAAEAQAQAQAAETA